MYPAMPDYTDAPVPKKRRSQRDKWVDAWEWHADRPLTPREKGYLCATAGDMWSAGVADPARLIGDALMDWPDYVRFVTSKGARAKYSAADLSAPHLDFFCQTWRLYCGR